MRNCRSRESDIRCTRLYSIYMNSIVVGWCAITLIVLLKSIYIGLVVEEEVVVVEWNRRHFGANHRRKNWKLEKTSTTPTQTEPQVSAHISLSAKMRKPNNTKVFNLRSMTLAVSHLP